MGKKNSIDALEFSTAFVGLLFLLELVDHLIPFPMDALGILPRTIVGLIGILFFPLLHGNFAHVIANALPLWILLLLMFGDRRYKPVETLVTIWVGSGLGTWLIGRGGYVHIGASALVFGLVTYLIFSGFFMRRWRPALIAILVLLAFGGMFYGVFPQPGPVSWEGHLAGAVVGVYAACRNH